MTDPVEALRAYHRWSARPENLSATQGSESLYVRARTLASAAEVEVALDVLEAAVQGEDPRLLEVDVDPRFDALRSHPRFGAVLAAIAEGRGFNDES